MDSGIGRDILVGRLIVAIGESSREREQRVAESSISGKVKSVYVILRARGREEKRGRERISLEQLDLFLRLTQFAALKNKNISKNKLIKKES